MNAVLEKINAVEREVLASIPPAEEVMIPRCVAVAALEVLDAAWERREHLPEVGYRAKAVAVWLGACIAAADGGRA